MSSHSDERSPARNPGDGESAASVPDENPEAGGDLDFAPAEQDRSAAAEGAPEGEQATADEGQPPRSEEDEERISVLEKDLTDTRERYLRIAAEYENYRKRTERERAEAWTRAQAQLVERLLEPLDDLQRVAAVDAESTSVEALLEGVQLVERKLLRALTSAGLEAMAAEGESFDPEVHEALMMTPTENREEDDAIETVFQNGYQFKGVLLRPARVGVKKFDG